VRLVEVGKDRDEAVSDGDDGQQDAGDQRTVERVYGSLPVDDRPACEAETPTNEPPKGDLD
jgi:hypothetical protein